MIAASISPIHRSYCGHDSATPPIAKMPRHTNQCELEKTNF